MFLGVFYKAQPVGLDLGLMENTARSLENLHGLTVRENEKILQFISRLQNC